MAETGAALPRDQFDWIFKLVRRAWRHAWLAIAIAVIGAAITVYVVSGRGLAYMSEAVVFYQEGVSLNLGNEGPTARKMGQRLKETVLARPKIQALIEEFKLEPRLVAQHKMADAVDEVRRAIGFKVNDGDTYVLSFRGGSPEQAQKVVERLTQVLIDENSRLRTQQADLARGFLDAERKRNEETLRLKETEVARFLAKHPEFASEQVLMMPGAAVRVASRRPAVDPGAEEDEPDSVLRALRREEERLRQQLTNPAAVPPRPQDPALLAAKNEADARLNAARRELNDRKSRFTDEHPDVRAAAAQVKLAEDAQRRAVEALRAGDRANDGVLDIEPKVALEARLAQVQEQIRARLKARKPQSASPGAPAQPDTTSDAAQRIVAIETEWARLKRELEEAKDRFEALDSRQFAATITATSLAEGRSAQIEIIDPAYLPAKPVGATKKRMILMGVAVAMLLGVAATFLVGLFDDRLLDAADVDRLGLAPVLIAVPSAGKLKVGRG